MPDASGNFKGIAVDGDAWERVFGECTCEHPLDCENWDRKEDGTPRCKVEAVLNDPNPFI